jgi:hypothetical protein
VAVSRVVSVKLKNAEKKTFNANREIKVEKFEIICVWRTCQLVANEFLRCDKRKNNCDCGFWEKFHVLWWGKLHEI